ncbi:methyltransferase domain-containing protein [Candidatus Woesearchaeota archaeon]|nr:methyltransferase domain-containing protein [Candidatus Woesearchaeota archaeon]
MKILFELSQENIDLAAYEVISLLHIKQSAYTLHNNFLIISPSFKQEKNLTFISRLAYTHDAYQILFSGSKKTLYMKAKTFSWQKYYKRNFAVRCHGFNDEQILAGFVYTRLQHPQVCLHNPETEFHFFNIGKQYIAAKKIWCNKKEFLQRKAHMKPVLHPTSLHPKLARAAINMVINQGTLLDPFCGSGGILVEAGFLGLKVMGVDLSQAMLDAARKNVNHYHLYNVKLIKGDAATLNIEADAIVTDLPYGKNSGKIQDINKLYLSFLKNAEQITENAVVMFPDFVDYKRIIKTTNWRIIKEFTYYLHKSLSKNIIVLKR